MGTAGFEHGQAVGGRPLIERCAQRPVGKLDPLVRAGMTLHRGADRAFGETPA